MSTFSFNEQLVVGSGGEQLFLDHYPDPMAVSLDLRWDFTRLSDGARVELKTDTYDPRRYQNFFFERYSDSERKTPGGPWRAKKDKIGLFIYFFEKTLDYYEFVDLKGLTEHLDAGIKDERYREFKVKNKGWVSSGYAVPRDSVSEFFTLKKLEIE